MNEIDKTETKRRIAIMQAWVDGKEIESVPKCGWGSWVDAPVPAWLWDQVDYRIKSMEFPKLPEGLTWHNPDNLTPEQVGDRKRLAVMGEALPSLYDYWDSESGYWVTSGALQNVNVTVLGKTFRLPISTPFPEPPKPKVMVPLEPHDISPTDVLRKKDRKDFYAEHWMKIDAVNSDGPAVHFSGSGRSRIPFKTLMNEWEISRDGAKTWKPCEKESAS